MSDCAPKEWPRRLTDADRLKASRVRRYQFAEQRIRKIVDGAPPLTQEMREKLAAILLAGPERTR